MKFEKALNKLELLESSIGWNEYGIPLEASYELISEVQDIISALKEEIKESDGK